MRNETREELEKLMDELAREYHKTRDPKIKAEMEELSRPLEKFREALDVLSDALDRCRREDMRTAEVLAALDFLEAHSTTKWPFGHPFLLTFSLGLYRREIKEEGKSFPPTVAMHSARCGA